MEVYSLIIAQQKIILVKCQYIICITHKKNEYKKYIDLKHLIKLLNFFI